MAEFLNASVAPENFDWDAFEGSTSVYGGEEKDKIREAYDQTLSKVVENEASKVKSPLSTSARSS